MLRKRYGKNITSATAAEGEADEDGPARRARYTGLGLGQWETCCRACTYKYRKHYEQRIFLTLKRRMPIYNYLHVLVLC